MRFKIDIDCTPAEARTFFGLPDLEPMQQEILKEVENRIKKRLALTDGQRDSILTHLLQGNDLSRWGLANAVTRASQDIEDYDQATELEKLGGKVIELSGREWSQIASSSEVA